MSWLYNQASILFLYLTPLALATNKNPTRPKSGNTSATAPSHFQEQDATQSLIARVKPIAQPLPHTALRTQFPRNIIPTAERADLPADAQPRQGVAGMDNIPHVSLPPTSYTTSNLIQQRHESLSRTGSRACEDDNEDIHFQFSGCEECGDAAGGRMRMPASWRDSRGG